MNSYFNVGFIIEKFSSIQTTLEHIVTVETVPSIKSTLIFKPYINQDLLGASAIE